VSSAHQVVSRSLIIPLILVILFVTVVVRLPFYDVNYIDWDEATYILMGADLLKGYLPYENLWEIKPPLVFYSYALFLGLFGGDVQAIRLGSMLWSAGTALVCFLTLLRFTNTAGAAVSALLVAVFSALAVDGSGNVDGQAFLTEHAAMLPFALSILYWSRQAPYLAGLFAGATAFMRPALALACLVLIFFPTFGEHYFKSLLKRALGLASIPLAFCLIYYAYDLFDRFMLTNYDIPRSVAENRPLRDSGKLLTKLRGNFLQQIEGGWWFLLSLSTLGIVQLRERFGVMLLVTTLAVAAGIYISGAAHAHYFLQLVVPLSLLAGYAFKSRVLKVGTFALSAIFAFHYLSIYRAYWDRPPDDLIDRIAAEFEARELHTKRFLCLDYHILYHRFGKEPPIKPIHPSIYGKPFILEPVSQLGEGYSFTTSSIMPTIFEPRPAAVLKKRHTWYMNGNQKTYMVKVLTEEYQLVKTFSNVALLYVRNDLVAQQTNGTPLK